MRIEFENGSVIECSGRNQSKESKVIRGMMSERSEFFHNEEHEKKNEMIKFTDKDGVEQASIPAHSDFLNAIVGYDHDPKTHNYNRAERRKIIKAAKRLSRKHGSKK